MAGAGTRECESMAGLQESGLERRRGQCLRGSHGPELPILTPREGPRRVWLGRAEATLLPGAAARVRARGWKGCPGLAVREAPLSPRPAFLWALASSSPRCFWVRPGRGRPPV